MSTSIVRQSLEIVDADFKEKKLSKRKKKKGVFDLVPEHQQFITKVQRKGTKVEKVSLPVNKKYTIIEAKQALKPKELVLKENKKKLQIIKQHSQINLDERITKQIIERGVSKRPIRKKAKRKSSQKTAFTEEDFKKFEEEYFVE